MSENNNAELHAPEESRPEIAAVLDAHRGERHIVVMQDFPDPDAISSALAHQLLCQAFEIEADLVYSGRISHQENIALVRLLNIELTRYSDSLDLSQYDGSVFVDNQGTTAEEIVAALEGAGVPPLIIVDHHEQQERLTPEFSDIRRTGAAATIYASYLQEDLVTLDKSQKEHVTVATALMHGIMTDTGNFTQAGADDFAAASFLSRYRDAELLGQIMSQARSRQVMEIIRQALGNRVIAESFSIAGIGYLRADDRDAIPQAADFLLSEENIHTALVYGIITGDDKKESLIGSLRTSKLTLDPDGFLKDLLGKNQEGNYFGGGKTLAGGFEMTIGFLAGEHTEEYKARKWTLFDEQIKQKIFDKIGYEPD